MKINLIVLLTFILGVKMWTFSQDIVYFEKLNADADFSNGQGAVKLHTVSLSSNATISFQYGKYVNGVLTNVTLPNVSDNYVISDAASDTVIGCITNVNGDTLGFTVQLLSSLNYSIDTIITTGFNQQGQVVANQPWAIEVQFNGPDNNCDAYLFDALNNTTVSNCVNNVLTISPNYGNSFFGYVIYNNGQSFITTMINDTGYTTSSQVYPTSDLLNAVIPRVSSRPVSATDCTGQIILERVSVVNDAQLSFAVNDNNFTSLTSDTISNLCGNDTLLVIGFSNTVFPADTLIQMQYTLITESEHTSLMNDLSDLIIDLNASSPGENCSNTITVSSPAGVGYSTLLYAVTKDQKESYILEYLDVNPYTFYNFCQNKYYMGFVDYTEEMKNFFSFTITDTNYNVHGDLINYDISSTYADTGICQLTYNFTRNSVNSSLDIIKYSYSVDLINELINSTGNTVDYSYPADSFSVAICEPSKLVSFSFDDNHYVNKFYYITDSLQRQKYNSTTSFYYNPSYDDNMIYRYDVPEIDTIVLYWNECTNNYSMPLQNVQFDSTDNLFYSLTNVGVGFIEYNASFSFSQPSLSVQLPQRNVFTTSYYDYSTYQPSLPYYIIGELFCDDGQKAIVSRRRIIRYPDGQLVDIYGDAYTAGVFDLEDHTADVIRLFPNPSNAEINIVNMGDNYSTIELFDLNMKLVATYRAESDAVNINISDLPAGSYIVQISNQQTVAKKKFIKL